jgi:hypothetical protein
VQRIIRVTAVVSVVSAVLAATATPAPSGASHTGKSLTLHLVAKDVGSNFVDNPPRQGFDSPPLIGDQFTFTSDLQTRAGKHAGVFAATCLVARGGVHPILLCHGFYSLAGGQIMGIAKGTDADTTQIAIVGGTGVYAGVMGTSTEVSHPNTPFTDVTIHLRYP